MPESNRYPRLEPSERAREAPKKPSGSDGARPSADSKLENGLLSGLPAALQEQLAPFLEHQRLNASEVVFNPNEPLRFAWFATSAVFSMLNVLPDGRAIEVGTVGPEGMAGIPLITGVDSMPTTCICQVSGEALRMDASAFKAALASHPEFRTRMLQYTQAFLNDVSQSVACNRLHPLEQRCARWILMTHDRVQGDVLPLTQQFLSFMLGVRRAGVSVAAESLQYAKLITYKRGKIRVLDREGLEKAACPCYALNRQNFRKALGTVGSPVA